MFKSGSLRRQWNGLYTCSQCWEPRQPQDFVRAVKDGSPPAWIRGGNFNPTITTLVAGFLGLENGELLLLEDGSNIRLETDITATDTSIEVVDGSGFPSVFPYFCAISDGIYTEGVRVTNRVGNVFTVVRGYNSTPIDWNETATFSLMS
jgi:hypothetical protein